MLINKGLQSVRRVVRTSEPKQAIVSLQIEQLCNSVLVRILESRPQFVTLSLKPTPQLRLFCRAGLKTTAAAPFSNIRILVVVDRLDEGNYLITT